MAIKRSNNKNTSATTGILTGLKNKQQEVTDAEIKYDSTIMKQSDRSSKEDEGITLNASLGASETPIAESYKATKVELKSKREINSDTDSDLFEQAKELLGADEELIRRTFTIESLTNTQLNELKVYILPVVTKKKKWGYNEIVNLAIKDFYARQKQELRDKVSGR